MLIIAQPKSASTSFISTLCSITKKNMKLGTGTKADKKCNEYTEIQKCHSIMGEKDKKFFNKVIKDRKTIYREHILPIEKHIRLLKQYNENIIILLRNPIDSWDSYRRMFNKNGNRWTKRQLLLKELEKFYNEYINKFMDFRKNFMIIFYEDLVLNYENTMKKVLKYWNLRGKLIPLQKRKYTGIGVKRLIKDMNSCY